jgi:TPR repeat protein
MARVFISHSSRDKEQAAELLVWLHAHTFTEVFLDFDKHVGLAPGVDWERTLYSKITGAEAVILILTANWFDSKWCFAEFTQARALGKAIFPLIESPAGERYVARDIQALDLISDRDGGLERLALELTRLALDSQGGFPWDGSRPAFPGLLAFQEDDAAIYFGRDDDIRRVIERLNARRSQGGAKLVTLLGSSGSGKSSLLRAGVLPRLKRDKQNWIVLPPFRPQIHPLDEFAQAIATALGPGHNWREWRKVLSSENGGQSLSELARDLRAKQGANDAEVLISIDQAEELFSTAEKAEVKRFLDGLSGMFSGGLPFIVLMALRSDYLGQLQQAQELKVPFEEFSLKRFSPERVGEIINGPARVAGLSVDPELVASAAKDAAADDVLPLLAFALRELYDRFSGSGRMLVESYRALGDDKAGLSPLENAVRRRADEVLEEAKSSTSDLQALKEAFVPALVRVNSEGEYIRRRAPLDALSARARPLIERLAKARLLVVSQDGKIAFVEVAHEALLRKWPLLRDWLDAEREFLIGKEQLERALADWRFVNQKKDALLQGLQLKRAQHWLSTHRQSLSKDEVGFIQTSGHYANRQKWTLRGLAILAAVSIGIVGAIPLYSNYVRAKALATASQCDRLAGEIDDSTTPGVDFDRIDTETAIPVCQQALTFDPTNPRLMHNLARSLDRAGAYNVADAWYQKAADLNWAPSENNLGVMYLYGRGVPLNLTRGISLLRKAVEQGYAQAKINYSQADFTTLFDDNAQRASIIQKALVAKGVLRSTSATGKWGPETVEALASYKRSIVVGPGVTLSLLDQLGVTEELAALIETR